MFLLSLYTLLFLAFKQTKTNSLTIVQSQSTLRSFVVVLHK